jgi:hypothetical protein
LYFKEEEEEEEEEEREGGIERRRGREWQERMRRMAGEAGALTSPSRFFFHCLLSNIA